jgi:hypothetical protein
MSPTTPTSSSVLISLLALGSLSGLPASAFPSPAINLEARQFGTGTGSGTVGCAALADSWNFSQYLVALCFLVWNELVSLPCRCDD